MKKILILDFDGVIIDSVITKGEAFSFLFKEYDLEKINNINEYHYANGGMPRYKKIRNILQNILNENPSTEKINEYCNKFSDIVLDAVLGCEFIPGSFDFICKERKNIKQYVVSATPQSELEYIINKKKIKKYFCGVFGSPISKDIHINKIITSNGYDLSDAVYIGDTLSDLKYAKKAGVDFIGFKNKFVNFSKKIKQINNLIELERELY